MPQWSVKGWIRQVQVRRIHDQACDWLFEHNETPTKIHSPEFIEWLNTSPLHAEQYLLAKELDKKVGGYLKELSDVIDVDALAEGARKEIRAARRRFQILVATGIVALIAAYLTLTAIA